MTISDDELLELERDVAHALAGGDVARLSVLGHGEISLVLGWPAATPSWACKRLPPFPDRAAADAYERTFDQYLERLAERGVDVVETSVRQLPLGDGRVVLYCIQPVLAADTLAPLLLRADGARAAEVLGAVVEHVLAVTDDRLGIDGQLSNWSVEASGLRYLDVTTPLLRDVNGHDELDTGLFLASLPWCLRRPVRRFVIPGILERYHQPRTVVLDLAANLVKERLELFIPTVLALANDRIDPPLTESEVHADYRSDARTWAALQAVRRFDRVWQRRVRRRPYPFLLPARIDRSM
ncbi:MAG TPA: DUF6206 family protein [Acidimicrobiales bacterium]|nr:DUF6206 family protein [Acidimicrobiales bacterium]